MFRDDWSGKQSPVVVYSSTYEYQSTGMQRLESKTDFKGQEVTFEYDDIGRLERKTWYNA